ncbi:MAG: RIM-binding protein of the cytomatrix active zone [Phormidesmis priestleyi Ana]|uniref:RIM-binding protein of the cytomatrix active zone n=1 Tax=Phormidesmis priestleyi Ana TaxID=1666911 RepID=A0A0P8DCF3_9CYAN|nr:MAG: RIM-binding protein of the cytomatrix active zone [Phormidesmis priestleyi Ana]
MSQDVAQWLGEIQSLQRQVAELKSARDVAYASADNLRSLYETEARQRQRDLMNSQKTIARLQKDLEMLQAPQDENSERLSAEIMSIQSDRSVERLQAELIAAKKQCEQLKSRLSAEQAEHAQTRESLTAALGDVVDLLAKERSAG